MRQARYWIILLPLFLVLTCVGAYAQANSEVTGIVTDQTGAVISGANITLTDPATGSTHTTVSSGTGLYDIGGLNAGNYNLRVTAKGFETYVQSGVVVNISRLFRVDVKLTVGAESQTITITADALTVQADSNVISSLISGQQITELATNGRNIVSLAELGLGVSSNNPDMNMPSTTGSSYNISFNGLNNQHNIWIIDGGEAYDRGSGGKFAMMPSQDAIAELQVLASNYPPDYGISSGGTITMSLKSGSQKFHGSAWEFDRNDAFNAYNYFAKNHTPVSPKAEMRYNVFGFNVGGPVFIPHLFNSEKKKLFFFYNEEWRRYIQGQSPGAVKGVPVGDNPTTRAPITWTIPGYNPSDQISAGVGHQIFVPQVAASSAIGSTLLGDFPSLTCVVATVAAPCATAGANIAPNQPFANNIVPANLLDANALIFNGLKNIPNGTGANTTWTPTSGKLPNFVRDDVLRVDYNINDKWQLMGHYIHDPSVITYATTLWNADNIPTVGSSFSNPSYDAAIKLTGQLTPNVLLEAAFNYDGNKIAIMPVAEGGGSFTIPSGWTPGSYYFPAANDTMHRLPNISLGTSGLNWGPGNDPWTNGAEDYNEIFGLSITKGKHALKFGGGYNRYTKNQVCWADDNGNFTFGDGWNGAATSSSTYIPHSPSGLLTGDSYLDFDLGLATDFNEASTVPIFHYVNNTLSAYVMDNWHATPRLSVQLGFRYDAMPHVWERQNRISYFNPALYQTALAPTLDTATGAFCTAASATCAGASAGLQTFQPIGTTVDTQFYMNGMAIEGQGGTPHSIVTNFWKTYQPRIGFSDDLFGNGKTILRGGFGTFFERVQGNDVYNLSGAAPFVNSPDASNVELSNPNYNWQAGAAATSPLTTQGPPSINTYYPAPAVAQYSLGVQHEILPALIWTTQYVGNMGWHQNIDMNINTFPLSTPMATRQASTNGGLTAYQTRMARTYPGYNGINQETNPATAIYNSLQTGIRQQNKHGLSYEIDYTWSHEIDTQLGSVDLQTGSNPWNLKYDRGSGALDRRHILNINYTYKLPIFAHDTGLTHDVLGGWEIAGTVVKETGLVWAGNGPPSNNYSDTVGLGGGYNIRAQRNPNMPIVYSKTKGATPQWIANNGAFMAPTAAWSGGPNMGFGNSGRDVVVGPGRTNFNTSLYKSFYFGKGVHFQFRAETFNTFNHTQLAVGSGSGGLNTNTNSGSFGQITNAADARVFQFGGKFAF